MGLIKEDLTDKAGHRGRASVGQRHESNCNMMLLRSIVS
jgi:hypothetical protein